MKLKICIQQIEVTGALLNPGVFGILRRYGLCAGGTLAEPGLHARAVWFSPVMDESMLLASGPDATENLYVAASAISRK